VIATHGFIKKQQKTPKNEIEKAQKLRTDYLKFKSRKQ
jgi:phage-related protein